MLAVDIQGQLRLGLCDTYDGPSLGPREDVISEILER
jgi:hypothetical protein